MRRSYRLARLPVSMIILWIFLMDMKQELVNVELLYLEDKERSSIARALLKDYSYSDS